MLLARRGETRKVPLSRGKHKQVREWLKSFLMQSLAKLRDWVAAGAWGGAGLEERI